MPQFILIGRQSVGKSRLIEASRCWSASGLRLEALLFLAVFFGVVCRG